MIRPLPAAISLMACLLPFSIVRGESAKGSVATDLESGKPAYTEQHVERFDGGRLIELDALYRDTAGDSIARRTLDFKVSPFLPEYRLEDFRDGWLEGARPDSGSVLVFCRKGRNRPLKEKRLVVPGPAVLDGGFNAFLKSHWEDFSTGRRVRFNVVVPARLDYYRFVAYEDSQASRSLKGVKVIVAEPESKVLRLLAPRIEFTFDSATRALRRYQGVSNIRKEDGGTLKVCITYQEGDR